jgi:ubiquinone biosynthesis protein Coq4
VPNPGFLPWHDLHHVATGYGTGLIGEAEISAYELRAGCGSLMIFVLCVGAILIAMFVAPRRVFHAWQQAKGSRSLYHTKVPYEDLLEMSLNELRDHLGLPRGGCTSLND